MFVRVGRTQVWKKGAELATCHAGQTLGVFSPATILMTRPSQQHTGQFFFQNIYFFLSKFFDDVDDNEYL